MKDTETVLWGIHAGRTGDADTLFLSERCMGVGKAPAQAASRNPLEQPWSFPPEDF